MGILFCCLRRLTERFAERFAARPKALHLRLCLPTGPTGPPPLGRALPRFMRILLPPACP